MGSQARGVSNLFASSKSPAAQVELGTGVGMGWGEALFLWTRARTRTLLSKGPDSSSHIEAISTLGQGVAANSSCTCFMSCRIVSPHLGP